MTTLEPVDIDLTDRDSLGEEDDNWDEYVMNDLQNRYEELRQFNIKYNKSRDEAAREEALNFAEVTRNYIEELAANKIYDKLTIMFNKARERLGINNGTPIEEPTIKYDNFKQADNGSLTFKYKRTVIDLGNINKRIKSPSELRRLSGAKLKMMGFTGITDEDTHPYVSVNSNWVHPPGQSPGISSKILPGGSGFDF